ncbi:MAG: hypothetical protein ABEJ67_02370 [Halanaeroarchaeum sp.]
MVTDDRGQGHTLEGIAAALLLLTSVVFALQVTAVTPLTASTASQHVETQYRGATQGMLAGAAAGDRFKPTLLYWNETEATFHDTPIEGYYIGRAPPTAFGEFLNDTYDEAGVAYNVDLVYLTENGDLQSRRLVHFGEPSDTAVTASRIVTLYDTDRLRNPDRSPSEDTLDESAFFAPDAYEGHLYNVVVVEVTVWRM